MATDEKETGIRKFLNFGHTVAHAIENLYHLPHGAAVAIGMVIACRISEKVNELPTSCTQVLTELLHKYQLPAAMAVDNVKTMALLKMDKKRVDNTIDYITLRDFGDAVIRSLPFETVEKAL